MENRAHALAAGLFMVTLGAALVTALWWFAAPDQDFRRLLLLSRGNITGLNLEARVRFRGIDAGKVEALGIDPDDPRNVMVRIALRSDLPVTRGTRASLGYQGVTGLAFIQLEDSGEDLRALDAAGGTLPRITLEPGLLDRAGDTALNAVERISELADRLARLLSEDNVKRLEHAFDRLTSAAGNVDRTFAEAPATLAAIREAVGPDKLGDLPTVLHNFERASREATPAIRDFRQLVERLDRSAQGFEQFTGSAGRGLMGGTLPRLNALLLELTETSRQISSLFREVEAAPQMLLLGRGRQAPGPGEAGFEAPAAGAAGEELPRQ